MSDGFKGLRLHNTLTRAKEDFVPIDAKNVRMYVCGPTVYDYAHIGNARPAIVFDVLYRLLKHLAKQGVWDGGKGETQVTYVRNITDVDDKINERALRDYGAEIASGALSLNEAIRKVTEPTFNQYQKDVAALGCLPPTHQPRATEFVLPRADGKADMVTLIQSLIDRGHAYVSNGEVLFEVTSMADYGQLSKRPLDEQQAGARVAVEAHKRNPADFVLWKQSSAEEPGWDATFRLRDGASAAIRGRPGWHIECSAMSAAYLGEVFDIHGGGLDLIFPHHENEIAQSRCAHGTDVMAKVWMHNGFLQVEGKKMSKSDGNFVTIHELLETERFGGRKWPGEVLRLAMLMTHYREPIDFSVRRLEEAYRHWRNLSSYSDRLIHKQSEIPEWASHILEDLNTPAVLMTAFRRLHGQEPGAVSEAIGLLRVLGFAFSDETPALEVAEIERLIEARRQALDNKNYTNADNLRNLLNENGIQLKDGKDPATGERVTTWEVKR